MTLKQGRLLLYSLGILLSVVPTTVCILLYFPTFADRSPGAIFSGGVILLLTVCAIPLFRHVKDKMKAPSMPVIWGLVFLLFSALSKIADEMVVISFVGFVSNLLGFAAFYFAKRMKEKTSRE